MTTSQFDISFSSKGGGQWRGGWGIKGITEPILSERPTSVAEGGHVPEQVFGVIGGTASFISYTGKVDLKTHQESELEPMSIDTVNLGEAVVVRSPGGGGWGDPLDRNAEMVQRDACNTIISLQKAGDIYGVILRTDTEL